jgi:hypothetical protein
MLVKEGIIKGEKVAVHKKSKKVKPAESPASPDIQAGPPAAATSSDVGGGGKEE